VVGKKLLKMMPKKASILVLTLWVLTLLVVFSIGIGYNVRSYLRFASHLKKRVKNYYLAQGGIERGIAAVVNEQEWENDNLTEKWANNQELFKDLSLDSGYLTLSYRLNNFGKEKVVLYGVADESSRININKVPSSVLSSLLERIGRISKEKAIDIAAAIKDWIDLDDAVSFAGAENKYYKGLDKPYQCKNGEFEFIEELLLVRGMTPAILDKIKEVITVYSKGKININTADALTLYALGLNQDFARRIIEFRQGGDGKSGTEDDKVFKTAAEIRQMGSLFTEEATQLNSLISKGLFSVSSDTFRVHSIGRSREDEDSYQRNITCVFRRQKEEPPEILYWRQE
jgi:general secretion pathway protein K